jgi:phosphoribosyl 1,2-cyclic phosphodiesterase
LLISHTHWDHIHGFPFFAPAYDARNTICIFGYRGSHDGLKAAFSSQMQSPYFPINWRQLPGHIAIEELPELNFSIGTIPVTAAFMNHPGTSMGYRLTTTNGSIAYLPDNEPYQRYKYHTTTDDERSAEIVEYARAQDQKTIEFVQDVDLLIIDSQYDDLEYQARTGWGHGCVDDIVALALKANVKRLCLFHHDPSHDDQKISAMVSWARKFVATSGKELIVEAAREGMEVVLGSRREKSKS